MEALKILTGFTIIFYVLLISSLILNELKLNKEISVGAEIGEQLHNIQMAYGTNAYEYAYDEYVDIDEHGIRKLKKDFDEEDIRRHENG